jgi:hypothetical protein
MPDAIVTIERAHGDALAIPASVVLIDGQVVGRLKRGRPAVFTVAAGNRLVTVWPGNFSGLPIDPDCLLAQIAEQPIVSVRLELEPGDRLELVCESNQPSPPPCLWYAFWYFIFIACLDAAEKRWPDVRELSDSVSVPLLIGLALALVFGAAGLVIWFRRAYALGAFTSTVISLTAKADAQRAKVTPVHPDEFRVHCVDRM